jgi:hypothetical protein
MICYYNPSPEFSDYPLKGTSVHPTSVSVGFINGTNKKILMP